MMVRPAYDPPSEVCGRERVCRRRSLDAYPQNEF